MIGARRATEHAPIYGLLAEFDDAERAARRGRADAREPATAGSTPTRRFPIEGLARGARLPRAQLPLLVLGGGIVGALGRLRPAVLGVGHRLPAEHRRPAAHSWPAFIPVTFEMTILFAALAAVLGMLALNGLPKPYHPVFNVPALRAREPRPLLPCIEARDPNSIRTRHGDFLAEPEAARGGGS